MFVIHFLKEMKIFQVGERGNRMKKYSNWRITQSQSQSQSQSQAQPKQRKGCGCGKKTKK